jgi:hypothetical protein
MMKYEINRSDIIINDTEYITVGVVLGPEDDPESPFRSETVPVSEFEKGLKSFKYGRAHINDCCCHIVGKLYTYGEPKVIEKKWIDELILMGYDVSALKYIFKKEDEE